MKDLIKKILREDFDWAVETPSYEDMKIEWEKHVIPFLTGQIPAWDENGNILDFDRWPETSNKERESLEPLAKHYFIKELNDVEFKDGKIKMSTGHWSDLTEMFKDCEYQGYICKYIAEQVLSEDLEWEPYYDVVTDWMDQVWDSVDDKTYKAIVDHIREHLIGDILDMDGDEVELTEELLTSWLGNKFILGQLINEEVGSGFEDLKNSMRWAYESAYNDASRDEYWKSTHGAIKGVLGESKWVSEEIKSTKKMSHYLEFDVTDIFMDVIQAYFDDYADLNYDHEIELEYSSFFDNLVLLMNDGIYDELLNPSVSEWPDDSNVSGYMNERLQDDLG